MRAGLGRHDEILEYKAFSVVTALRFVFLLHLRDAERLHVDPELRFIDI